MVRHHLDFTEMPWKKARWELQKDTVCWNHYLTKQQLYGHLFPILKIILVRWTRYVVHCWRIRDKFISNICPLNKSWKQNPTKQQLHAHLLPILKTILVRWTRHVEHCWRIRDEFVSGFCPLNFYTWTNQCWMTSKNLHSSALCRQRVPSRRLAQRDGQWENQENLSMSVCSYLSIYVSLFISVYLSRRKRRRNRRWWWWWHCSSHRFIFSRKSMPAPSDLATHWPISGQSAMVPSSSKELFFLALFWKSATDREHTASREERPHSCNLPWDTPALMIFTEDNCCYLLHTKELTLRPATVLLPDTQKNVSHSDTSLLSVITINHSLLFFKKVLLFCSALHKQLQINL